MTAGILAKKVGMTQVFDEEGNAVSVTVLEILENVVTTVKTKDGKDQYNAIQIGAKQELKEHRLSKAEVGHCKSKELDVFRVLKEYRVSDEIVAQYKVGDVLDPVAVLGEKGTQVDIQGQPIGKGTMGIIKRHHTHRRLMSHGHKHHRHMGSAGPGTTPARVLPGKRMAGRQNNQVTVKGSVFSYDLDNRILLVVGSVPSKDGIVSIKPSTTKKDWNKNNK